VNQAQRYLTSGDVQSTCSTLTAFTNEVHAQSGTHLAPATTNQFVTDAERIQAFLAC
jgi:hypothetical protein